MRIRTVVSGGVVDTILCILLPATTTERNHGRFSPIRNAVQGCIHGRNPVVERKANMTTSYEYTQKANDLVKAFKSFSRFKRLA